MFGFFKKKFVGATKDGNSIHVSEAGDTGREVIIERDKNGKPIKGKVIKS